MRDVPILTDGAAQEAYTPGQRAPQRHALFISENGYARRVEEAVSAAADAMGFRASRAAATTVRRTQPDDDRGDRGRAARRADWSVSLDRRRPVREVLYVPLVAELARPPSMLNVSTAQDRCSGRCWMTKLVEVAERGAVALVFQGWAQESKPVTLVTLTRP